jgi:hypothetical protein
VVADRMVEDLNLAVVLMEDIRLAVAIHTAEDILIMGDRAMAGITTMAMGDTMGMGVRLGVLALASVGRGMVPTVIRTTTHRITPTVIILRPPIITHRQSCTVRHHQSCTVLLRPQYQTALR